MADPEPQRPWFQIHLSTAIVLMFVAGGLLYANLYVAIINPTIFDAGLPLLDYPRDRFGMIAFHTPFTLPINVCLNIGLLVILGGSCEWSLRAASQPSCLSKHLFRLIWGFFAIGMFYNALLLAWEAVQPLNSDGLDGRTKTMAFLYVGFSICFTYIVVRSFMPSLDDRERRHE